MSVQQLSSEYIKKVNPQQVQQWIEEGRVKQQGNQYFVAGNNINIFPDSCYVKDGDAAKIYKVDGKGTIIERTTSQPKGEVVGTPQKSYSISVANIIERMGLTDENLKTAFNTFLSNQQGLTIDKDGNINFSNQAALNNALASFAKLHQESFVDPKASKFVEFTPNSDQAVIAKLKEDGAIVEQPTEQGGKRFAVQNEAIINDILKEQIGETSFEASNPRSASVEAGVTTTSTTKEGMVDVPENLRDSKFGRKQVEKDAREAYSELVANADSDMRDAIDLYIAERKYNGKIDKKMNELLEYKTTMGGTKEKKAKRDAADIVQLYIDKYANKEDRGKLNNLVTQIQNSETFEDQQAILKALKDADIIGLSSSFDDLPDSLKRKGALICVAEASGYDSNNLLRLMATYEVMNNRSTVQVLKDDKYFIEQQAKDFTKNQQVTQDVPNTTVYFSKKGRKGAFEDGKIHNDIGNKGRELVKACPEMLCDEITDVANFKENEDGYFKADIDGKTRYFKFSQDKWQTFMGICCDPSRATDAEMNVLFGDDKTRKEAFLKDLNLTLQEGRSVLEMNLPSPYGKTGTLQFANIIGNNNGKIDNKELNALRNMVKSAGYSADSNTTYGKRLLHVLKNAGIGAGIGILTGGMGSLLAGAVNIAGTTLPQMVGYSGKTDNRWLNYSGKTDDRVIHDSTTFKYTSDGEEFTKTVNKNITVEGQDYNGQILAEGQEFSGEVRVEGQDYRGSGNNHLKTAANAGILGGIAGGVRGLATMGGVHERGRNIDDIFNLTRLVEHQETIEDNLSIEIPQFTSVQTRRGQLEVGTDIKSKPAVKWRYLNAYTSLYNLPAGTSEKDFVKAYKEALGLNGTNMPRNEQNRDIFVALPEITINGQKCSLKTDWETLYDSIPQGTKGGGSGQKVNIPQGKRIAQAQGTIKS